MARVSLKKDFRDGDKLYGQQLNNNFGAIEAALDAMNKIVWQDDPDESVTAFRGTTEQIQSQPIIDGQLLYDISTGETYTDYNGERVSTGSGNAIHIGADTPENDATQIWIDPTEPVTNIGTEVVNSLDGDEIHMAPSVHAIKSVNTYSTEEIKTGDTWIDGKPIYRKVLTGTLSNTGAVNFSIQDAKIINYDGFIKSRWGSWYKINDQYIAEQGYEIFSSLNANRNQLSINCGTFYTTSSEYEITLEYTKTTDGSDS